MHICAQASIAAWPSGVSVADFRSDIIKCRLSGSCLPLDLAFLAMATATFGIGIGSGGVAAVSYRYDCVAGGHS